MRGSARCLMLAFPIAVGCGGGDEDAPSVGAGSDGVPSAEAVRMDTAPTSGTEVSGDAPPADDADCSKPRAAPARLRLLSESQYDNAVLDLLGVAGNPGQGFGAQVFAALDDTRVEQRANAAAAIASQAAANLLAWSPCVPSAAETAECARQIVEEIGTKAYRRPLSDPERSELQALFDAGVAENGFVSGVEWFLTGLLQSPDFSYEVIRPAPDEVAGEVRALSSYEYASRLAFLIWDGPPDDALTAAASNGDLDDSTKLEAELSRMMRDPRFSLSITQFYSRWLNLHAFGELAREAPGFGQNVVNALEESLLMSATELYASDDPNISNLFSGESYYFNDVLREFYGLPGEGADFTLTAMPDESRRGILTHPALMALLARPSESFPIARGLFLLRTVLCVKIPNPPAGFVIPQLPSIQEGVSTRQRFDQHTSSPVCAGCHSMIDPAGFAFESFDEVGRFRTVDHGIPVDTSGELEIDRDIDGAFATGDEVLARLGSSEDVKGCFAEKYLNFALSREETDPADSCSIESIGESFTASGDLRQLVTLVAKSDAFRLRLAEGVGQ
jgi:hypothetical protein